MTAARRVCCHACGARVLVGETAHDAEPADDGAERFACAEHCEVCRQQEAGTSPWAL